jgi:hypothetical protein
LDTITVYDIIYRRIHKRFSIVRADVTFSFPSLDKQKNIINIF